MFSSSSLSSRSQCILLACLVLISLLSLTDAIRCYKCKGDDECDFKTRQIYIENCTWATKCWGARIGGHFIRSCADDRCDIQVGVGSYIESKCCYSDLCNNDEFFFPNQASSNIIEIKMLIIIVLVLGFMMKKCVFH
jgi:hypothetical protein